MVLRNVEIMSLRDSIPVLIVITSGMISLLLHRISIQVLPITQIMLLMSSRPGHFIRVALILQEQFSE